jgi:hypothetical protein
MRYKLPDLKTIITAGVILLLLVTVAYGPNVSAAGHSVTRVTLNPTTPNILVHGQDVTVSFNYATIQQGGVRIFARPFVGASPAPNYAASGAGISPTGSGTGTQTFTIKSGTVTVDRIRIQMWNTNQTQLLFEAFLPVNFEFRAP